MELWTEYEGRTIDGAFLLKKLLLPEGRSAFFSTSNLKGDLTVIRLIACHFDEDEIIARWRGVEALNHPNILKLERYGQVVLDETTVVYAVIEPVDANLAEVVSRQRLTVSEARQLGSSLASALEVLHTHGFVHEHVEPANVFAVGEVVKLRGDCIREAPEGERGPEAKRRDIHDLAVVLLQALTQERTLEAAARRPPLPASFDEIVRKGMSGAWGMAEITAALQTAERTPGPRSSVASSPTRPAVAQSAAPAAQPASSQKSAVPDSKSPDVAPPAASLHLPVQDGARRTAPGTRLMAAAGLVLILVLWLVWHFGHSRPSASTPAPGVHSAAPTPGTAGARAGRTNSRPVQNHAVPRIGGEWRVVAYTYNHEDQAQKKSATVARKHPELRPEVFTPSGHAPYLVTVGGAMNRDEALAFVQKSRNLGLPRDTYAQNYSGKGR